MKCESMGVPGGEASCYGAPLQYSTGPGYEQWRSRNGKLKICEIPCSGLGLLPIRSAYVIAYSLGTGSVAGTVSHQPPSQAAAV